MLLEADSTGAEPISHLIHDAGRRSRERDTRCVSADDPRLPVLLCDLLDAGHGVECISELPPELACERLLRAG